MFNYIPYVYLIKNKTTQMKYLGVRYAKGCHPIDLWNTYFTSSKLVHRLINEFGKDDWIIKILHSFPNSPDLAIQNEAKYFSKIKGRKDYLNMCYSSGIIDLECNSKAGKIGGTIVKERKIGIFRNEDDRKKWCSMGGKIGGKKQAELGLGFHKYKTDPELHKKWCSMGGQKSCQFKNKKFQSEMGRRGGIKNSGSIYITNGYINKKYTVKMQQELCLNDWLKENLNWKRGMIFKQLICNECGYTANAQIIGRYHNENCKNKKT
jgi:hypothetical protein